MRLVGEAGPRGGLGGGFAAAQPVCDGLHAGPPDVLLRCHADLALEAADRVARADAGCLRNRLQPLRRRQVRSDKLHRLCYDGGVMGHRPDRFVPITTGEAGQADQQRFLGLCG